MSSQLVRLLSVILIVALVAGVGSPVHAQPEPPRAHPALLQLAAEYPDNTFMVIIQREVKNKELQDDDPETAVIKAGGKVRKQLQLIESFAAELTGKEIEKLARRPKVRWISFDAPLISTAVESMPAQATTLTVLGTLYTVTNSNNSGTGSLRQAITDANGRAGVDTIRFNIAGTGVHTIVPTAALPTISSPVILDATTDDSFAANGNRPAIILDGNNLAADGLVLSSTADGSTISGLVIRDFGTTTSHDGIDIQAGSDGNTIIGNYIGRLTATGADAGAAEVNTGAGISVLGNNNKIGGVTAAERNVITGNSRGVHLNGATLTGNTIEGNYIGINASATILPGTGSTGVLIQNGADNTTIKNNIIGGATQRGIEIWGASSGTVIQGNSIGTDSTGLLNFSNSWEGIYLGNGAANNLIGGVTGAEANRLANNARGIRLYSSAGAANGILGNSFFANTEIGLDLQGGSETNQITANNGAKTTGQPNLLMDYPVITAASLAGCWLNVAGYVGSAANQSTFANARVEFFKSSLHSNGYGEGKSFLGYLTSDASGNFNGAIAVSGFNTGDRLTATATDSSNNTSEFGANFPVTTVTGACPANTYTVAVGADRLWTTLKGQGITIAVVDSGINNHVDLQGRILAHNNQTTAVDATDNYVHGTHVAGIIGGSGASASGARSGMAPLVNLINVKVSNDQGVATASDLIDGLQWILNNKATYNIRVVNISLNSTVPDSYHASPLNAAVEILWFNGITVVVAAGNNGTGSGPVTLYPPANDPFVITVGAAEDRGTPALNDDTMAPFSAYGTTEDSFAKPDLVAPGRNIISLLASTSAYGYLNHLLHRVDSSYFRMSGTSMAAPIVSGAVALLLQDEPGLTPDQVKYRLKATANTLWPGYDAAKAGAGYLDIYAAVYGTTTQSANTGLTASQLLTTGSAPINSAVSWNSVSWNSVSWNSVSWNSVSWNTVSWNTTTWSSAVWDDAVIDASSVMADESASGPDTSEIVVNLPEPPSEQLLETQVNRLFLPLINQ